MASAPIRWVCPAVLVVATGMAQAHLTTYAPGESVGVTLASGEELQGRIVESNADEIRLDNVLLGELVLPASEITAVAMLDDVAPASTFAYQPEEAAAAAPADPISFFDGWKGSVDLGINGTDGNTRTASFRAGLHLDRKTSTMESAFNLAYYYSKDRSNVTSNEATATFRNDWLLDGPWRAFAEGRYEFDDFQDWDSRVSAYGGIGYEFIDNDKTFLLGRVGFGLSREIGGQDNTIRPEALLGFDFRHQLTDRQKFETTFDLFPDLADIGAYRFIWTAGWELLVDPETNMSLKAGLIDSYDSTPNGRKRNDIAYYLSLGWNF